MEENGKLVSFIFRGREVVAEESQEDKIRYIRTGELLASGAEYARTYYHYASDEMGSITHVVTGEGEESAENGEVPGNPGEKVLNHYEYDAWGNLTACEETVENRFKFNGQQYDPVTQQYYLRARYYNPVIGRFTQEDTYRGDGLNLYAYCRNNPVYYVDPSGHAAMSCRRARETMRDAMRKGLTLQDLDAPVVSNLKAWLENKNRHGGLNDIETVLARRIGLVEAGQDTIVILPSRPHRNGTIGHWETILSEVERMRASGEYSTIYVNKGLSNEIAGATTNRRPDIMGVRHNGLIDQVEVPSITDNTKDLRVRMEDNRRMLGDRAGEITVREIGDN